jgi:glyceraldehyde 3-phosphate dehydrogenase
MAMRVPVIDGSVVDLVATFENPVSVEAINSAMQTAAEGPMKGILQYCTDPVVSSDIIGNPHSSIFDSMLTTTIGTHSAKILSWYDNEWGYSSRVVDLIDRLRD